MDISNKALAMFLLAAIVVSLGGTIVSLNRLGSITTTGFTPASGEVLLSLDEVISITTADNATVDFGNCENDAGTAQTVNSEGGADTSTVCDEFSAPAWIAVRNNGNVDVNVTIQSNVTGAAQGGSFLASPSSESSLQYRIANLGDVGGAGCEDVVVGSYTAFAATGTEYLVCGNLTSGNDNTFRSHFQIVVPHDAIGSGSAEIIFTAEKVGGS